jgi:predicted esterase
VLLFGWRGTERQTPLAGEGRLKNRMATKSESASLTRLEIPFLSSRPALDGLPKAATDGLPKVDLPLIYAPVEAQHARATLNLAYGAEFLYLQAEFPTDKLVARDRGYQFGDGLIVVVAEPMPDGEPSPHYYLLGFSYQERPEFLWARSVLWEHDCISRLLPLGRATEVGGAASQGIGRLEVSIPWSVLHPYHPWLSPALGLNVVFIKAVANRQSSVYALLPPEYAEQVPRTSIPMSFARPTLTDGHQIAVVANGRIRQGERLRACMAVCGSGSNEDRLTAHVRAGEGDLILLDRLPLRFGRGLTRHDWDVNTSALTPGGYRIQWRSAKSAIESEQGLSVIPPVDLEPLRERARAAGDRLPAHDAATLAFEVEDLTKRLAALAPSRTAGAERLDIERLLRDIAGIENGENPLVERRGIFRRAFRSEIDGTLQPFSVLIPQTYAGRSWPLCVAFHGSGVDDMQFMWSMGARTFPDEVLVVAPFGRGASNSFTQGHAQKDVSEAIASMCATYAVNPDRIFLMGFSMGAYGALRTYYENPTHYRGVAAFSTPPTARLEGESYPDFTKPEFAKAFAGIPVFVFHGRMDNSVPIASAEEMVQVLKDAGALVTFVIEDETGHALPTSRTWQIYSDWLEENVLSL